MPYRDEAASLKARIEMLSAELEETSARLERARAALASVVGEMSALPADAELPWRSLHGGEPVSVRFANKSARKVELRWVNYDGRERAYETLIPGGERTHQSYAGHLWRMVDVESGACVLQRYARASEDSITFDPVSE
jgi:hypothetical protein